MAIGTARADFTATYTPLAPSPLGVATSWYSGAVTNDGKFVYGLGHSHNAYGNNSLWAFDPATNSHSKLFPDTGNKWKWDTTLDSAGKKQVVPGSGHWATLDPVADKALVAFFGGPTITALPNRNNHQAFYMPARNEFWVLAGTTMYQSNPYFAGRFDLATNRWTNLSKNLAEFSAGLIAGKPGWVAPNAATAVCKDLNTVVLFGGMNDKYGGVRMIEPNPGPEPYRWASAPKPPIHLPAENVRHNAVCVGDTVYFSTGQQRFEQGVVGEITPNPGPFWKFHVPTRVWTRLPDGPPGGYFATLTYDSDNQTLLYYGGGTGKGSDALWVYDLTAQRWTDLTGTVADLPRVDMYTGGFIPGFGHVYKGGRQFDATGRDQGYGASSRMMVVRLVAPGERPRAARTASSAPASAVPTQNVRRADETVAMPTEPAIAKAHDQRERSGAWRGGHPPTSSALTAIRRGESSMAANQAADALPAKASRRVRQAGNGRRPASRATPSSGAPNPLQMGARFAWTKLPLPGPPNSASNFTKHVRIVEGPGGRVWVLGGDWNAPGGNNTGHQEVYSFDPNAADGDWKLEAPYCFPVESPQRVVHFHTDEAGVAWDAKRSVFWKLAGTVYGPEDTCYTSGRSVKAKVIQFYPAKREWKVPLGFDQKNIGYVTNGVLDPVRDEMIQIVDKAAFHLSLETGQWKSYPLPGDVKRFTALTTRIGREVWFGNQKQFIESYNLDTHMLTNHGYPPWPTTAGYGTFLTANAGGKLVIVKATAGPEEPRRAGLYDPAIKQWTVLDQGEGWGNSITTLGDGRIVLMGGGINGPAYHNKFVWVGQVK